MDKETPSIQDMKKFADELSQAVSELLAYGTNCPDWSTKQAAWRHPSETQNAMLFVLLKLAGAVSATNAMLALAENGFWFECAILSRTIYDANLTITFILPGQDPEWPSAKQKTALKEFFMETWDDPEHPFLDSSQRSHISIKDLKEGLARFQNSSTEMNPYDSGQTALQMMRFLSDYTHMAYPRLMELLEAGNGYRLSGDQPNLSAFGLNGVAATLNYCASIAHTVSLVMLKMTQELADLAKLHSPPIIAERLAEKSTIIKGLHDKLDSLSSRIESATIPPEPLVSNVLRNFKTKKNGPAKGPKATSGTASASDSTSHQH